MKTLKKVPGTSINKIKINLKETHLGYKKVWITLYNDK